MNPDYSQSTPFPTSINTVDDAIAYLQKARKSVGGNAPFRMVSDEESEFSNIYKKPFDVVIKEQKSLMKDVISESVVLFTF